MTIIEMSYGIVVAARKEIKKTISDEKVFPLTDAISDVLWKAFDHRWDTRYADVAEAMNGLENILMKGWRFPESVRVRVMSMLRSAITDGYEWHTPLSEATDKRPSSIQKEALSAVSDDALWAELAKRCEESEREEPDGGWPISVLPDDAFSVVCHYLPRTGGGVITSKSIVDSLEPELREQIATGLCTNGVIIDDPDIALEIADTQEDYVFNCMRFDLGLDSHEDK